MRDPLGGVPSQGCMRCPEHEIFKRRNRQARLVLTLGSRNCRLDKVMFGVVLYKQLYQNSYMMLIKPQEGF